MSFRLSKTPNKIASQQFPSEWKRQVARELVLGLLNFSAQLQMSDHYPYFSLLDRSHY